MTATRAQSAKIAGAKEPEQGRHSIAPNHRRSAMSGRGPARVALAIIGSSSLVLLVMMAMRVLPETCVLAQEPATQVDRHPARRI